MLGTRLRVLRVAIAGKSSRRTPITRLFLVAHDEPHDESANDGEHDEDDERENDHHDHVIYAKPECG